jgi:hypothetical protein
MTCETGATAAAHPLGIIAGNIVRSTFAAYSGEIMRAEIERQSH